MIMCGPLPWDAQLASSPTDEPTPGVRGRARLFLAALSLLGAIVLGIGVAKHHAAPPNAQRSEAPHTNPTP